MTPFEAPVEAVLFSLQHVAGAHRLPGWDAQLAREVVRQFARFAAAEVAPVDEAADREGCRFADGGVQMPAGLVRAYRAYVEQGWSALELPEAAGGQAVGGAVAGAITEIFAGASHSLQQVVGLVPGAARTLLRFGSEAQQAKWLPRLASGEWLVTMALTEPGAGSDLSGIRTRGRHGEGGWTVEGEKIFITGGDQDLTPRILHLVLARTGDAASGVKGLSLFLVPSHDDDGNRQPVTVGRIEDKLGLHASPTCQMLFDGAAGELVGAEGGGLAAMFTLMNRARLDVALQGVAHAARAAQIAAAYAATRRQGRAPGQAGAATLDAHADVRRMIDAAEALAVGGRALSHVALVEIDLDERPDLVDFLTPVCKFACTEGGIEAANLGIQVLGGYGYLREYRVEQALRDARITAIYEGANGIHALTLATRLLRNADGAAATAFAGFLASEGARDALAAWQAARDRMLAAPDAAKAAHAFMLLTVDAALSAVWLRLERNAAHAPDPERLLHLARLQRAVLPARLRYHGELLAIALAAPAAMGQVA